jgi:hypothetical protein
LETGKNADNADHFYARNTLTWPLTQKDAQRVGNTILDIKNNIDKICGEC